MDIKKETCNIGLLEKVCETSADQALDAELNLPDYCPAIQRIIKCNIIPNIISTRNQNGKITVEVNAVIRLIYASENGGISSFEQTSSFEKTVEHSSITQDSCVKIKIKTDYVNCRAINPRKADIRSMLKFICNVTKRREEKILTDVTDCGIQTMREECDFSSVTSLTDKIFSVSEIMEIPEDMPVVVSVLDAQTNAVCNEIKVINNKALVKGECNVKIYYIADENGRVECVEHNMPISQIVESEGLSEEDKVNVEMSVYSCEVFTKVNSKGEMRQLDINVGISSFLVSMTSVKVNMINDAYSTDYDLATATKSIEMASFVKQFDTTFTNKTVLESIGVSVDRIICSSCGELNTNCTVKDGDCHINGSYEVTVLYYDSEKQIGIIKKPINFDYSVSLDNKPESIKCFGSVSIIGSTCAVTGESRLEIKTEMAADYIVLSSRIKKYIGSVEIGEKSKLKNDKSSLTIYYAEKGESVWNIARKYCTTVEAVISENELDEKILSKDKMLLIPAVE